MHICKKKPRRKDKQKIFDKFDVTTNKKSKLVISQVPVLPGQIMSYFQCNV